MKKAFYKTIILRGSIAFFLILFLVPSVSSKMITQFTPTLSVTEEYTDNYNQTENNKDDEFSTIYGMGLSFGLVGKNSNVFLEYNPGYTDYESHDESDSWSHNITLNGMMQPAKNITLNFSETFERDLVRTLRSNSWEEHDTNTTSVGGDYEFGRRNIFGLEYTYQFDDYEDPNADEFTSHNLSMNYSYWFTPQWGLELDSSYEKTEYDISTDESETWSGELKILKSITRHFDTYISYSHTYTDQTSGDHTVYNPSVGFDWQPVEDSGISVGVGILFQEWEDQNPDDSEDFFLEFDMYKDFNFSRKGTLSVTGSSGYVPTSSDAASLGFNIYYEVGCLLSYRLTKTITSELSAAYAIDQFEDPSRGVDREDNTLNIGAGLGWSPLRWLSFHLSYSFADYNTDAAGRGDYQENVGTFNVRMTPSRPVRFNSSTPRTDLENRIFN